MSGAQDRVRVCYTENFLWRKYKLQIYGPDTSRPYMTTFPLCPFPVYSSCTLPVTKERKHPMETPRYSKFYFWSFIPVFNFIAWIHAGIITKLKKYYIFAGLYFLSNFLIEEGDDARAVIYFITFAIGVVHALKARHAVTVEAHKARLEAHKATSKIREDLAALDREYGVAPGQPAAPAAGAPAAPVLVERVIIKEIVRIPCTYCGSLVENTVTKCPNCGGDIR